MAVRGELSGHLPFLFQLSKVSTSAPFRLQQLLHCNTSSLKGLSLPKLI